YARHGVKEYWLVDTDAKTVMVLLLGEHRFEVMGIYGEDQALSSPTLKGFTFNVSEAI
ncbi:MAG: Uma2 family endonuclease, partial [Candidatus Latescibacteria bacterium]|nr:Uma2 family endonuclease [Candidatus Latescibacterota bacterium]